MTNAITQPLWQIWQELRAEAGTALITQPALAGVLGRQILSHDNLPAALAHRLSHELSSDDCDVSVLLPLFFDGIVKNQTLHIMIERDLIAYRERDPACHTWLQPVLFFKGFAALQCHRVAHQLWRQGQTILAYYLQSRASALWQIDIHPAAQLGAGLFIDHATGVVIGETCRVGDDVTMMHNVTLGGNGKECGDRHPKIGHGVLLSVGAKVLGNIMVGDGARVAAGSVVLKDVAAHMTVAGIPAHPVGSTPPQPADCLDHAFNI